MRCHVLIASKPFMPPVRFGQFAFDPDNGELWRAGVPVRLQAQPAKALAALVARPGQLLTRESLQREIWGAGTHVDFERGLNFCIAQIRTALGDSAESPRFVETVPRQGYRFIAPVHPQASGSPATVSSGPPPPRRVVRRAAVSAMALLGVLGIVATVVWVQRAQPAHTVVVVPFYNETGRPDLDPLTRALGDATVASLAAPDRLATLSVIGNAPRRRDPFARKDVQQVAQELRAQWLIIGQLKTDGEMLRFIAHLIRASDMKHLWARSFDDPTFNLESQSRTAAAIAEAVSQTLATD